MSYDRPVVPPSKSFGNYEPGDAFPRRRRGPLPRGGRLRLGQAAGASDLHGDLALTDDLSERLDSGTVDLAEAVLGPGNASIVDPHDQEVDETDLVTQTQTQGKPTPHRGHHHGEPRVRLNHR